MWQHNSNSNITKHNFVISSARRYLCIINKLFCRDPSTSLGMTDEGNAKRGFTLIELSVVLIIVGLLAAIGVAASKSIIDTARQSATQNRMDAIERSLFAFWKKNGRMPCPASLVLAASHANYGIEATSSSTCTGGAIAANYTSATNLYKAVEGGVPVVTLGLPKDYVYDGWGKKIAYAVTPPFAQPMVNGRILPKSGTCYTDNGITIKDAAGAVRSDSAVYALISLGKNGHGAYSPSGSRYNAKSTNSDELVNCHCTNAAVDSTYDGNYIQRSQNLNTSTIANYFDDIVRFKELWQIYTSEDSINDDGYRGPDLAVAYSEATTGTVYAYKNQCGGFVKQADLNPLPTQKPIAVAFTTNNKHLLTYSALGCNLYKIGNDGTLIDQASAFSTTCSYNSSGAMALSDNAYLAIADTVNIKFWKQAGDSFLKISAGDFLSSDTLISFSPDAKYLAVLPTAAGTTVPIYKRSGDSFSAFGGTLPTHAGATAKNSVAFSPDGKYLAATSSANIYLWRILESKTAPFVALSTISPAASTGLTGATFSPDGRYFAVGKVESPYLLIYKIDANDTFTLLTAPTGVPASSTGIGFAFSKDSNYLAMVTNSAVRPIFLFQKTSASSFQYMSYPFPVGVSPTTPFDSVLSGGAGVAASFRK